MRTRLLFLIFLLASGCAVGDPSGGKLGGVFDGNPATRPTPGFTELELRPATSTSQPIASSMKSLVLLDGTTVIDEVRFFVSELELIDGGPAVFNQQGPFVVRLLEGGDIVNQALPAFGGAVVPDAAYSTLNLKFLKLTTDLLPEEASADPVVLNGLLNHSMVVEGSISLNGIRIPFRFLSNQTAQVQVNTPTPFNLDGDYLVLFLAFKIQTWMDISVLDALLALDPQFLQGGLILLDTQSNNPTLRNIALQIEANIDESIRLAPSEDGVFQESDVDEASSSGVL